MLLSTAGAVNSLSGNQVGSPNIRFTTLVAAIDNANYRQS